MSPSASRLLLLGNPRNRRVQDFVQAAVARGLPKPNCLSYEELLEDRSALQRWDVELLRVDSPGENEAVARALIALGGGPAQSALGFGEIAYLREYHLGFCRVLDWVRQSGLPCLNQPAEIAEMFDKWACHQRFVAAGLPRPRSELAPSSFSRLREGMKGHGRIFLKPLHGSSASGVCALRWAPGRYATRDNRNFLVSGADPETILSTGEQAHPGRVQMIAPLRIVDGALVNSLRLTTYQRWSDIELILGQLLPQGMIAEQWIPKLALDGGVLDLRVLVIAGRARHRVVRQSLGPMTNLHLGNSRGDEAALRAHLGEDRWAEALGLAERAAACFPGCLYAGVDILLDSAGKAWVGEINAFGDLLPGLTHQGESAYSAIAEACQRAGHPV